MKHEAMLRKTVEVQEAIRRRREAGRLTEAMKDMLDDLDKKMKATQDMLLDFADVDLEPGVREKAERMMGDVVRAMAS